MENTITKEYPFPEQLMDNEGYPTEEALEYIRNWGYEYNHETDLMVVGKYFNNMDRYTLLIDYLKSIWTYNDAIVYEDGLLEIHTYGWSGNEDIIHELKKTIFWTMKHQATQTGGHYYFKIDPDTEYKYVIQKVKK